MKVEIKNTYVELDSIGTYNQKSIKLFIKGTKQE